nr:unnamed protein product [Spirometra erinaceieuropaei]
MKAHFEDFVPTELFVHLPAETLLTVLRGSELSVASEESIIAAIARWVDAGPGLADDGRLEAHAPTMIKEVQWHQTSVECRDRLVDSCPTLWGSRECLRLMFQILNWIGDADKNRRPCPFIVRPRGRQAVFFVFGRDDDAEDGWSVFRANSQLQQAERVADMEADRSWATYSVLAWLPNRWHKLPDLQERRWAPAAASLPGDNRVFVFGGFNGSFPLASVKFCHLGADWREQATSPDFWQPAAPMRTARWRLAAAPFRGTILVAGGVDSENDTVDVVEMFTPPEAGSPLGQWTELAGMQEPRSGFTLLASANVVFALGGNDNTVEELTAPECSANPDDDLTAWIWSPKGTLESLSEIAGAVTLRM